MNSGVKSERLSFWQSCVFSLATVPVQGLFLIIVTFLPAYFATNLAVSLAVVATVFTICRTIDIPLGPAVGAVMDRTSTPWGRYRVWLVAGAPLMSLGLFMLLRASRGVSGTYMIAWLMTMYLGQTIMMLAHSAWTARIARSYAERSRLFAFTICFGTLGSLCLLGLPWLCSHLTSQHLDSVHVMAWFIILTGPIAAIAVALSTPEPAAEEVQAKRKNELRDYLDLVVRPTMRRLLLADILFSLAPAWMGALQVFFSRDRLGLPSDVIPPLMFVSLISGIVGAQITARAAAKYSKHYVAIALAAVIIVGLLYVPFIPHSNVAASLPLFMLQGAAGIGFIALIRSMIADVAEEILVEQGKDRSGLLFSLATLTNSLGSALAVIITFPLVGWVGYDAKLGLHNTPAAMNAFTWVYMIGPMVLAILGALVMTGYPLTPERVASNRRILDERAAEIAAQSEVDAFSGPLGATLQQTTEPVMIPDSAVGLHTTNASNDIKA